MLAIQSRSLCEGRASRTLTVTIGPEKHPLPGKRNGPDSSPSRSVRAVSSSSLRNSNSVGLPESSQAESKYLLLRRRGRSIGRRRSGSAVSRRSSGSISGRSSRSVRGRSGGSRCGFRGGRRSSCGVGAGGFLLRAGRQHQRRNECAKSEFGVHRSVPQREARVVLKRYERVLSFRESLRIAAANSIDSTVVLKQSPSCLSLTTSNRGCLCSPTGRPRTTDLRITRRNMASGW